MVLLSSDKFAMARKLIKEIKELSMNTVGAERVDDEHLGKIDEHIKLILKLLVPATDER